jgi:hypothetical protein
MSEAALHVLRTRLDAGLRHKAARGELRQLLPVGLDYDSDGRIVLSPDEAVRAAITVVFDRFSELGSARQVLLSLRADGLRLPRRTAGSQLIRWAEATYPAVHDFVTTQSMPGRSCSAGARPPAEWMNRARSLPTSASCLARSGK